MHPDDDRTLEPIVLPMLPVSGVRKSSSACSSNEFDKQSFTFQSSAMNLRAHGCNIDKYPAKSHARRIAEKLKASDGTIAIAASPSQFYPGSDQQVPFRQDRDFYYLTGSNEPGQFVTYDLGKDSLKLWLPAIDEGRVVWTGRGSTVDEALEKYDIDEAEYLDRPEDPNDVHVYPLENLIRWFQLRHPAGSDGFCAKDRRPLFLLDYSPKTLRRWAIPNASDYLFIPDSQEKLRYALDACRVIKDEHEIGLIRKANKITTEAHLAALKGLHSFKTEAEVDAAYTATCIARNAKEQAYSPIVGSGSNASVLHYDANNETFGDRQVCVMDAGCEVHCYASDVTRSFPLNKSHPGHWPSKEAKEIYQLVEKVQEACIEALGPGRDFIQIVLLARRLTLQGLMKLGVLKGRFEDIWKAGTVMGFFPHGLGHHVGLEVHDVSPLPHPPLPGAIAYDVEDLPFEPIFGLPKRFDFADPRKLHFDDLGILGSQLSVSLPTSRLEPGMVVTIEPGCYFNSFLLERFFLNHPIHSKFIDKDVLERYWEVGGVRIEDDILITRDGYENLTTTPKGEEMLEVIRDGAKKQ